jgi:hypothetical protein
MDSDELAWIQGELEALVIVRNLDGLTPLEECRYRSLAEREARLLAPDLADDRAT